MMLYRENLSAHEWSPPVPNNQEYVKNERQWLILSSKVAFLHVYIACQTSRNDDFMGWNEDLFNLVTHEAISLRRQGITCLAMGDFNTRVGQIPGLEGNTPDTNRNHPMFMNFIAQVNMTIINTMPISKGMFTRFMYNSGGDGSKSLLDYGLIDNDHLNTVTSFVIDEDARFACGSDHALLQCEISVGEQPSLHWSFKEAIHYNITEDTNYTDYMNTLEMAIKGVSHREFSQMSTSDMYPHLSESISKSAMTSIGLKVKKAKQGRKLPASILRLIRTKNSLASSIAASCYSWSPIEMEEKVQQLNSIKAEVKDAIADIKLEKRHRLRSKLLLRDPTSKKFWRFLRSQIRSAGCITAAYDSSNKMVFDQSEIEDVIISHFSDIFQAQRVPVFPPSSLPDQTELALAEMEHILSREIHQYDPDTFENDVCSLYTHSELDRELASLADGKASGYDCVPNELLKHTGAKFRQYLFTFLNKVLEDGEVPQDLNIGKCLLVHKV